MMTPAAAMTPALAASIPSIAAPAAAAGAGAAGAGAAGITGALTAAAPVAMPLLAAAALGTLFDIW
jgi:hypothetical protein